MEDVIEFFKLKFSGASSKSKWLPSAQDRKLGIVSFCMFYAWWVSNAFASVLSFHSAVSG